MQAETRLTELGIVLPPPPKPIGSYLTAVQTGNLLYLSGTTCYTGEGQWLYLGRVGAELSLEQGREAARQAGLNLLSVIRSTLGSLDRVVRVVKLNGYVNSASDFDQQPAVINGASDLMREVFGEMGRHARTSIGVNALPGNIPVEIEMIVEIQ